MSKKNLPNIPIYIGDWEKDCNVLSLEAEAAWLRIVFKLWTKGKQNSIKIPSKSLQNLWKCSADKIQEILDELIYNEIADIKQQQGFVEFTCRRFEKENELSKIRSNARKGVNSNDKTPSKPNQKSNKSEQNSDYDNDNESVIKSKNVKKGVVSGKKEIPEFEEFKKYALENKPDVDAVDLKLKYGAWRENGWRDGNNRPISNWRSKLLNTLPYIKSNQNGKKTDTGKPKVHEPSL